MTDKTFMRADEVAEELDVSRLTPTKLSDSSTMN